MELVHSQYLKQNVVNSSEMAHAKFVVGTWSHKHGMLINIIVNLYGGMGWRYECTCTIEGGGGGGMLGVRTTMNIRTEFYCLKKKSL